MTRNRILAIVVVLCLSFLVTTPALAAKDYHAKSFDVRVDIQNNGSLIVTETINFQFDGGPFTYVFREVSRNSTDAIAIMDASMDGITFPAGSNAGQVEIIDGDPLKVTWHFVPTSDSTHTFVLRYQVQGAIRTGSADTLIWRAVPEKHDYSIDSSAISVTYPLALHPLRAPTLDRTFTSVALDSGYRLTTAKLETDESAVLTIAFGSGSLVTQPPAWQALQEKKDRQVGMALPYGVGAASLTALLGLLWVLLMGRSFRKETNGYPVTPQTFSVPPRDIPAALAARLTGSSYAFLGSLFDLASRAVLRMEEGPKKWGSRSFSVIQQAGDVQLQPHEQIFLKAFFKKAKDERVDLSDIASLAYNSQFTKALDQELTALGWRDEQRNARRGRFLAQSVMGMLLGLALMLAGLLLAGASLTTSILAVIIGAVFLGIGVTLSCVGLVGLIVAALITTLSEEGMRQAAAWKSFTGYLRGITRGKETVISKDVFERYLPYAAGFGIATEWTKYFQKMGNVPVPEWFQGLHSSVEDGSFAAILAAVTAADSSASAGAGGGAAGASGGGSSGAG